MTHAPQQTVDGHVKLPLRHVAAVLAGNALEFYDFLTYSFFALQIGRTFFPAEDPSSSLLLSLATFGAGFLTRPVGGIVIGRLADRIGRRPAMMLSFSLMGIAIVGIALTPSYRSIGPAAPVMVLCWRLLQGFALGGEVGPTTAFLVEAPRPARRGFYGSLQAATQYLALVIAGLVGFALSSVMGAESLDQWGWRIAFLFGAAVIPVGLVIRRSLPETLHTPDAGPLRQPAKMRHLLRVAVLGLVMLSAATIQTYVLNNLTTYAVTTLGMSTQVAFAALVLRGVCGACFSPVGGWLSDRVGRKPVMISSALSIVVCVMPAFLAVAHLRTPSALFAATALLTILGAVAAAPLLTAIMEALPHHVRASALGTVYAVAISVFGGSTQFVVTWLTHWTGNPLMPGWYMAGASAIGLVAMIAMRETAPVIAEKAGRSSARPSYA